MRIVFAGMTHLALTLQQATFGRGIDSECFSCDSEQPWKAWLKDCHLVIIGEDVESDADLPRVRLLIERVIAAAAVGTPIVVMSQVPPGFTRAIGLPTVYYQADTLRMRDALERALNPERHIVGCADPSAPLPPSYANYLDAFPAPILKMSYESAELAKIAVNFMLASSIAAATTLRAFSHRKADWADIERALRTDSRIGERAYVSPGVIGGHLPRDVLRVSRELYPDAQRGFAEAVERFTEAQDEE